MAYRYSNTSTIDDLSDAELLAHFFVNSSKYPALDKARDLINEAGSLSAVIFAHNHPSKVAEPSDTDVRLTRKLVDALSLIDVRVLDHLIVGGDTQTSLAERGLM